MEALVVVVMMIYWSEISDEVEVVNANQVITIHMTL